MSSPYVPFTGDYPDRHAALSPANSTMTALDLQEPSIRPMRLKVLYSFDADNKTNCLARWPEILNIRTAHLDESTQIGVIELKTCIQAIVTASPEITTKMSPDYTVYAYDYSEYDTPQVGQGMLSRVLASASPTPSAPAHESDTIVTGRVCKSMLGLFANGIQETLEVKLRLVPVPTSLQNEYCATMKQQREMHQGIPDGVDPRAWTEFLKANPGMMSVVSHSGGASRSHSPVGGFGQSQHGIEHVQKLLSEGYRPPSVRPQSAHQPGYSGSVMSGHASNRSTSPTPSLQSMPASHSVSGYPRPLSRVSNDHAHTGRRMSVNIPTDLAAEEQEGPARKRAKVMKADHPGKSKLGKTFDTLRATASTAASIRVLQPTAVRPTADAIQSLEGPPRAPTPTPGGGVTGRRPALQPSKSGLGRELTLTSDSGYRSLTSEDVAVYSESAMTSPDNAMFQSDFNSPEDSASSPPVIRPQSAVPTSPILPAMPQQEASFAHSEIDDLFGETDHLDMPWDEQQFVPPPPLITPDIPPFEELRPPPVVNPVAAAIEVKSQRNAGNAIGFKRALTWSGAQPPPKSSSVPPPMQRSRHGSVSKAGADSKGGSTKWDKDKRKAAMDARLKTAVQSGQLPPFCENCGAIETPTWRKAFSRIYAGDHSHLHTSNNEGGIICIQIQETNEDGSTKLFKMFKKSLLPEDTDFQDVLLCNPCGIWLSNHHTMRPETHWVKKKAPGGKKSKKKKTADDYKAEASDAANATSDAGAPASEASMTPLTFGGDAAVVDSGESTDDSRRIGSAPKASAPPAEEGIDPAALLALERALRSSPGRFLGSRKSPIEVDGQSPDPARRSLFPSPKSGGPLGVDIGEKPKTPKKPPPKTPNEIRLAVTDADKENLPPSEADDLFSDCLPNTPSRKRPSPGALFKTPAPKSSPLRTTIKTDDFFSSAAKVFLHAPQTPKKTPKTPSKSAEMTPFTRHLNQLLSEPNMESPSRFLSELSNLPYPTESMPFMTDGSTPSRLFRSGEFDFSDFPSSDGPMPSSPPAWFGIYQDGDSHDPPWDLDFVSSPAKLDGEKGQGSTKVGNKGGEPTPTTSAAEESSAAAVAV